MKKNQVTETDVITTLKDILGRFHEVKVLITFREDLKKDGQGNSHNVRVGKGGDKLE